MIVTPTTDVVLDVLQAADPVAQRAATAKLDALKSAAADFSTMQSEVGKAAAADGQAAADAELGASNMNAPGTFKAAASGDVYRKFEAFVLQVFVETMLPQQTQELFGKGTAGNVWRSMLAEQLGNQLAQGKGIGIAKQLAAAHPAARNGSGKAE
ncbi:hypothetical protein CI1B_12170 [Bradyrhizobium ivorense]|uniref:Flagellar protein FlgJ N-terminal domain-containing protein n=1 Tax=Bradyrhizobium ivorense TaxID=2511166 RepID=A0A508ST69_9BRAD|nr:rod-binding protein [Bradyrhizobium ivorense]MCC8938243.1 rod-binding protein [Bradyrhizobium ivorense]VIO66105.1 hypothetical protein CI1B_12170 [Bradyrhizobium ivorense]